MNKWGVHRVHGGQDPDQDQLRTNHLLVLKIKQAAEENKWLRTMISLAKAHLRFKETLVLSILTQGTKTET